MSAVQVRITTNEYAAPTFAWYEIFASQTELDLADVVADAEFRAVFVGDLFLHANLIAGEEWFYWVRALYDHGATEGAVAALGSITITGGAAATSGSEGVAPKVYPLIVLAPTDTLTTGDGKAHIRINEELDGLSLIAIAGHLVTVSSSGIPTIQIHNVTAAVDMLTTKLTIDASEKDSKDATTPAVIDAANAVVQTGDELRVDCDVAGTGAKGLIIEFTFG